jgi:hypothetical protein
MSKNLCPLTDDGGHPWKRRGVRKVSTHGGVAFGQFLRTDPELLAAYRERTGMLLTDMPRVVTVWRAAADSQNRDGFSPAEAEKWLLDHAPADGPDVAELHTFAAIWNAARVAGSGVPRRP